MTISVYTESPENPKISAIPRETKMKMFPQGTYIAQTFIPKTSTILYSGIAKGISEIYELERELGLSRVIQRHQSSVIHSFIFVHSLMSENDKNVP